ncbi:hypothetical protein QG37_03612 [Candidozyma auris]|uniref:Uncharacterized protein n=1 Tax=Candidozyma auris TaxID=498019 RepID=A0A0L0P0J2_CANAR|nr:hypothetical protein QG37_03612 [[Candida] auris]
MHTAKKKFTPIFSNLFLKKKDSPITSQLNGIMSLPESFNLTAEDAKLLLAANVHLGSKNVQVCYTLEMNETD